MYGEWRREDKDRFALTPAVRLVEQLRDISYGVITRAWASTGCTVPETRRRGDASSGDGARGDTPHAYSRVCCTGGLILVTCNAERQRAEREWREILPPAREGDGYSSPRDKTPTPCRHHRYDTGLADVVTETQHLRMRRPRQSAFGCGHYAVGGGHCTYGCGDAALSVAGTECGARASSDTCPTSAAGTCLRG